MEDMALLLLLLIEHLCYWIEMRKQIDTSTQTLCHSLGILFCLRSREWYAQTILSMLLNGFKDPFSSGDLFTFLPFIHIATINRIIPLCEAIHTFFILTVVGATAK